MNEASPTPKFKRILLKLSGEALMGADAYGINRQTISEIVGEVKSVVDLGVQVGVVIGGGKDTAGPVVFEGAAEHPGTVGPKGAGDRVAFQALVVTTLEAEAQRLAARDPFASLLGQAHHTSPA